MCFFNNAGFAEKVMNGFRDCLKFIFNSVKRDSDHRQVDKTFATLREDS